MSAGARLEEVAKKARVSVSTASRVVNGFQAVSPTTRRRVLAALQELHYTPNLQARSLVSGRSNTLGVIVSNLENPFFIDLFRRIETQAHKQGLEVLLANTNYEPKQLARAIQSMLGRRVAGLLIAVSEGLPREVKQALRARVPVVSFGSGHPEDSGIGYTRADTHAGMRKLVEYLRSLGHNRMAYVAHRLAFETTEERRIGFFEAAEALGVEHTCVEVLERDGPESGRDAVRELARRGFNASAILCLNDITAVGVLRELRNRGLRVPEDVSVTGFDNIMLSEFTCPSMTTVHIPLDEVTRVMFRMLAAANPSAPSTPEYLIDAEVLIRESTGPHTGGGLLHSATK